MSIPEWKVMATVAQHPGLSAVHVARHAGLDTVAVSRAVIKLVESGRISREFGKEDRRRSILELSEEGQALYAEIMPMAASLQSSLLEDLTEEEQDIFARALKSLHAKSRELIATLEAAKRPQLAPRREVLTTNRNTATRPARSRQPGRMLLYTNQV
jgi:DNA-binding MarR family transcriptional regulator